ncbi:bifunctional diguanylate cyclase/phosphodiesterase [Kineosporia rhizophila]|uniref:putative bifunctional diguanylate cyclase/phosphodiesterase n=1 Tax=Kineosporia rhizophila TaxID=84633 RepID=UPI001E428F1E|nr:bifunctional diguanylate cyclase/phosphodiesterase [Kineosporia rhizophila]MCE0537484.1 bifunctional diguanylate cyclase/phosphodiesterase [Kineosporia rhizophila]
MRTVRGAFACVLAVSGFYTLMVALHSAGLVDLSAAVIVGFTVVLISGYAVVCWLRAALVPGDRVPWTLIGCGLASYAAGSVLWQAVLTRRDPPPYPSVSDLLWLAMAPLVVTGIWLMVRARVGHRNSSLLDGLVAGLGVASVAALLWLPGLTEEAGASWWTNVVNFAYPLVDLALAASAIGAMAAVGAWRRPAWLLLSSGFLVFTAADIWYLVLVLEGTFHEGEWNDWSYLLAIGLIASAALVPPERPPPEQAAAPRRYEFLVPVVFGLLPIGVLVAGSLTDTQASPVAVGLAVAALVAVAVRTALAIREVVALSDQRRLARTDSLTGLPNRRALYDLLEQHQAGPGAVMIIDLDRFKEINDALGHQVGDELLRQVSARFTAALATPALPPGSPGPPGTIARLGGDEFAVLLPHAPREQAAGTAAALLHALNEPFVITDTLLHVGASIGITSLRPGRTLGRALAEADLAMYRAKTARTGFEVYDDSQDNTAWDRLALVEALRLALDRQQLSLAFQPIVQARTGRARSVEALARWNDPERGTVPPDVFLPLAEHAGLMPALTRNVLDLAFDEAAELRRRGHEVAVSVNLSASDLLDGRLEHDIARRLHERDLPAAAVKIEITESLLVDSGGRAGQFLLAMRELGIELLVDDFGTGYSSMAYLHDLPVSTLKIDRAFTSRLATDRRTGVIVASTIEMAHRLGLDVVAEGVETEQELAWLQAGDCDLIQGYLTSRPLSADDLHAWLEREPALPVGAATVPVAAPPDQ